MSSKKFLIIGPYPYQNRPNVIGGASILYKEMISYFDYFEYDYIKIPLNKYENRFRSFFFVFRSILINWKYKNVILNLSQNGILFLFPLIFPLLKILNFNISVRFFGSYANDLIDKSGYKVILYFFLSKVDFVFVETKFLIKEFDKRGIKSFWFPNTRKRIEDTNLNKKIYKKRFVYIGHIKQSKGVGELISVFSRLENYELKIYGYIQEDKFNFLKDSKFYHGFIDQNDVCKILSENDVLILPTYYEGEGYPGVIVESYMSGLPVITTKWKYIPEIVDDKKSGILIKPKSENDLENAILSFNQTNYKEYSRNALNKSLDFETNRIHNKIIKLITNGN